MKSKTLSIVGLLLVLAGLGFFAVRGLLAPGGSNQDITGGEAPVAAGDVAADFKLQSLSGKSVTLSSLRGKVVFLNVWATWCGPCREEMPSMETLYEDFKGRKDFVILAVSQDRRGRAAVQPFVERNHLNFDVLLDPDNVVGDAYNVSGVPETFIIDRKGRIVAHHMGAFDWSQSDVRQALAELLDSKEG
ncbi:MAG: TlpA family protein disulfide reductase [Candidatus Binataceae bacterium]